jgi:hypothetical protein
MLVKVGARPENAMVLSGRLELSSSGWLLLAVPNALVRGVFQAMHEPGIELPPSKDGELRAHISVMTAKEVEAIGVDKINERGKVFKYQLGPIKTVAPQGWLEMSAVYFVEVSSPELKRLRRSYGLSELPYGDHAFHISCAVKRKGVLRNNDVKKAASSGVVDGCDAKWRASHPGEYCPKCHAVHERGDDGTCNRCGHEHGESTRKSAGVLDILGPLDKLADDGQPTGGMRTAAGSTMQVGRALWDSLPSLRSLQGLFGKPTPPAPQVAAQVPMLAKRSSQQEGADDGGGSIDRRHASGGQGFGPRERVAGGDGRAHAGAAGGSLLLAGQARGEDRGPRAGSLHAHAGPNASSQSAGDGRHPGPRGKGQAGGRGAQHPADRAIEGGLSGHQQQHRLQHDASGLTVKDAGWLDTAGQLLGKIGPAINRAASVPSSTGFFGRAGAGLASRAGQTLRSTGNLVFRTRYPVLDRSIDEVNAIRAAGIAWINERGRCE